MPAVKVRVYTGSRGRPDKRNSLLLENVDCPTSITVERLAEIICERLTQKHGLGAKLSSTQLHPAEWDRTTKQWKTCRPATLLVIAANAELTAIVVPDVSAVGTIGTRQVALSVVVRSTMPWYALTSTSQSTHDRKYLNFSCQTWSDMELTQVMPFLDECCTGMVFDADEDPREYGNMQAWTYTEAEANEMYHRGVRDVASAVFNKLNDRMKLVDYEVVTVFQGATDIVHLDGDPRRGVLDSCRRQAADYIAQRKLTYGFLTNQHGTFFYKRVARDRYAITRLIAWDDTEPGVLAMMTYILIKQLQTGPWEDPVPPAEASGVTTRKQHEQQLQQQRERERLYMRQQQQRQQQQQACCDLDDTTAVGHSDHTDGSSSSTPLEFCTYPSEALESFQHILGRGLVGAVTTGRINGQHCAIKLIDTGKQAQLLPLLQREVGFYGRLQDLQGRGIPALYGAGFVDSGNSFFLALSVVERPHQPSSSLPRGAREAAEQVLHKVHEAGVLHGDISPSNVLLQEVNGSWKAWIIDFGHAQEAKSVQDCQLEIAQLAALFRQSVCSQGSDVSMYADSHQG